MRQGASDAGVETVVLDPPRPGADLMGGDAIEARRRPLRLMVLADKAPGISPGQRYRLEQWGRITREKHGIALDIWPFEPAELTRILYQPGRFARKGWLMARAFAARRRHLQRAEAYDGVIIYRWAALIGPPLYERLLARTGKPTFFDFDDALWEESGKSSRSVNGLFAALKFRGKTPGTLRDVDCVLAGNRYLADWARQFNDNVQILPSSIDLASYPVVPEPAQDDPVVIGWTGSHTTLAHFEHARGALERLARRRPVTVRVICSRPPDRPIAGAQNVFVPWKAQGEAQDAGDCHIGIMPLPDDHYTRGKCGLKALQFMATGRPVVIAPVGMNVDLIRHGENGFLAGGEDEWVEALDALAASRALRARVGAAARATVEEGYSAEVVAERFAAIVRTQIEARSRA